MKLSDNAKKAIVITLVCCAVIFVLLFAIVNMNSIWGVLASILAVFSPILIGFAIAYILNPLLRLFEFHIYKRVKKKSVLRGLSIVSTYLIALLCVIAFFWLIIPSLVSAVKDLITNYDTYIAKTSDILNEVITWFMNKESVSEYVNDAAIKNMIARFFSLSGSALDSIMKYVVEYGSGLFVGIKNTFLGIFISIYVLLSKEKLQAQFRKFGTAVFSDNRYRKMRKYISLTHRNFSGYFVGKFIGAIIVFCLMFALMLIFRMPYPLLISTIFAVTDFIPIFGPLLGAIPSFFIIFIIDPTKALIFLVIVLVVQQLEGNVITPKILGEATGISSLSVIIAIIIMGHYFGIIGMIIGVPLFAVGITIVKEIIDTKLRKKEKSTDTADYYLADSVVDPHEQHEPFARRIFSNLSAIFLKFISLFKSNKKDCKENNENEKEDQ